MSCKDYFIIGSHLLRLFRPLFNYDRETITLYTKLPVDNTHKTSLVDNSNSIRIVTLIDIMLILLFLDISLLAIVKTIKLT